MTQPDKVIILSREPGPNPGTLLVTVDAPGFTQAQFLISDRITDTELEQAILLQQIAERIALRAAANEGEV